MYPWDTSDSLDTWDTFVHFFQDAGQPGRNGKILERYGIPRLNQEEIENMNRSITNTEIETVITKFTKNKSPRPDDFTGEVYQTF